MPRVSSTQREEAFERLRNGAAVTEIADEFGVSTQTASKWQQEATGEPGVVTPPTVRMVGKGRKAKHGVKPVSDETAGMIAAGLFSIAALVDQEPCWYLTEVERKALAEPLAESLKLLPGPMADAVNTYTAPGLLVTASATIINNKLQYRAAKRAGKLRPMPHPQPMPQQQQRPQPDAPPPQQSASEEHADHTPPPSNRVQAIDADLAAALLQAKGALADDEENGEGLLSTGLG